MQIHFPSHSTVGISALALADIGHCPDNPPVTECADGYEVPGARWFLVCEDLQHMLALHGAAWVPKAIASGPASRALAEFRAAQDGHDQDHWSSVEIHIEGERAGVRIRAHQVFKTGSRNQEPAWSLFMEGATIIGDYVIFCLSPYDIDGRMRVLAEHCF